MGVSKNRGIPKWMVKIMENPIKMDDLGVPLYNIHILYKSPDQASQFHCSNKMLFWWIHTYRCWDDDPGSLWKQQPDHASRSLPPIPRTNQQLADQRFNSRKSHGEWLCRRFKRRVFHGSKVLSPLESKRPQKAPTTTMDLSAEF